MRLGRDAGPIVNIGVKTPRCMVLVNPGIVVERRAGSPSIALSLRSLRFWNNGWDQLAVAPAGGAAWPMVALN